MTLPTSAAVSSWRPPRGCLLALALLLVQLQVTTGYSEGHDSCDRTFPGHGINHYGLPGTFSLKLYDMSNNQQVTTWDAFKLYRVFMTGLPALFRGYVAAPFVGTAASNTRFNSANHAGALRPMIGDASCRPMRYCDGGVTHTAATNKQNSNWTWVPPPAGTGTVTIWAGVQYNFGGNNYEIKLEIPESTTSVGVTTTPSPAPSSSMLPRGPGGCYSSYAGASQLYLPTPSASPSSSSTVMSMPTVITTWDSDGWGGSTKLGSSGQIYFSWRVLPSTQEISFSASIAQNVWLGIAMADSMNMSWPSAGVAVVGTPAFDSVVSEVMITRPVNQVTGFHSAPVRILNGIARVWNRTIPSLVYNSSMMWTRDWNTGVCEDKILDPYSRNGVQGFIYAFGIAAAFGNHGTSNRGFARIQLINAAMIGASSASATASPASASSTSTGTSTNTSTGTATSTSSPISASSTISASPSPGSSATSTPSAVSATPTSSSTATSTATATSTSTETATGTATATATSTATASFAPPSPTPSPSSSPAASSGEPVDPSLLMGSTVMGDINVFWRVNLTTRSVFFSMSSDKFAYLSLARAASNSMIWPNSAIAVVGVPSTTANNPAGASILLYRMDGYDLASFTAIPFANSGVGTDAGCVWDGTFVWFNFTRSFDGLGVAANPSGPSAGDLGITPSQTQGYIYARGYTDALDGHEVWGYADVKLQSDGQPVPCDAATDCSGHGTCDPGGSGRCVCDNGYAGSACDKCDALYSKLSNATGFTCVVKAAVARATVVLSGTANGGTDAIGSDGSAARVNISSTIARSLAPLLNVSLSRLTINVSDTRLLALRRQLSIPGTESAVQARRLTSDAVGSRSVLGASAPVAVDITVSIGPTRIASQASSSAAARALLSSAGDGATSIGQLLQQYGIVVTTTPPSSGAEYDASTSYTAEAPFTPCSDSFRLGALAPPSSSSSASCRYPLSLAISDHMAVAWRIDESAGLAHFQTAFIVPYAAPARTWYGIAIDDDEMMTGGDAIAIEPGALPGQRINRYILNGYTTSACPATGDDGILNEVFSDYLELSGATNSTVFTATTHPALHALSRPPSGGDTVILATFSRRLSTTGAGVSAARGSRALPSASSSDGIFFTLGWGPPGALRVGAHTSAQSGFMGPVNLSTGQVSTRLIINAWVLALHALLCLAAYVVFMPLAVFAATCGRKAAYNNASSGVHDPKHVWTSVSAVAGSADPASKPQGNARLPAAASADGPFAYWRRAHAQYSQSAAVLGIIGCIFGTKTFASPSGHGAASTGAAVSHWSTNHDRIGLAMLILTVIVSAASSAILQSAAVTIGNWMYGIATGRVQCNVNGRLRKRRQVLHNSKVEVAAAATATADKDAAVHGSGRAPVTRPAHAGASATGPDAGSDATSSDRPVSSRLHVLLHGVMGIVMLALMPLAVLTGIYQSRIVSGSGAASAGAGGGLSLTGPAYAAALVGIAALFLAVITVGVMQAMAAGLIPAPFGWASDATVAPKQGSNSNFTRTNSAYALPMGPLAPSTPTRELVASDGRRLTFETRFEASPRPILASISARMQTQRHGGGGGGGIAAVAMANPMITLGRADTGLGGATSAVASASGAGVRDDGGNGAAAAGPLDTVMSFGPTGMREAHPVQQQQRSASHARIANVLFQAAPLPVER